jgi:Mg-chelatase subunit ChlD
VSRRELAGDELFERVSPDVGELDERAVDEALAESTDEILSLLATLSGAVDEALRAKVRDLACRVVVDMARSGPAVRGRAGRLRSVPLDDAGGDLDLDRAVEAVAAAPGGVPDRRDLRVLEWERPDTAVCLVIDRSGSMHGEALATAALAAAAVACRAPVEHAVLSFAATVDVIRDIAEPPAGDDPGAQVVDAVLGLRGHGTTDLAAALLAAGEQLSRSRAGRRMTVVLSDCRATEPGDVVAAASALDELVVIAPDDDATEARALAAAAGARCVGIGGPADVVRALDVALSRR